VSTKVDRVFIDLDGVLCDWLQACCTLCGIDPEVEEVRPYLKKGMFIDDLLGVWMWEDIRKAGIGWWANIPIMPWSNKLVESMKKLGTVCFLTSPGKTSPGEVENRESIASAACAGKIQWQNKHFPDIPIILAHAKHLVASPSSILIDDSKKKIEKFREYGGKAFLWPNIYNFIDGNKNVDNCIKQIKREIIGKTRTNVRRLSKAATVYK
jgi:5'(3')-deoxyribonucleotidase